MTVGSLFTDRRSGALYARTERPLFSKKSIESLVYGLQDAEVATEGPFRGGAEVTALPIGQKKKKRPVCKGRFH